MARGTLTAMLHGRQSELGRIRRGDHAVFIYHDARELTAFVVPFIRDGLAGGDRCLYIVDDLDPTEATEALAQGGVDVKREIERGALLVVPAEEFHDLSSGAPRAIERHLKRLAEATPRGFAGLRVAEEMTWVHKVGIGGDALVEYESMVDEVTGSTTIVCLYRRGEFPAAVLQRVVRYHEKVIADDNVYLSINALFQDLARADLKAFTSSARERPIPKGGFYFQQGDRATEVFVLTGGAVKLERTDPEGQNIILRIVNPMEPFGGRAAVGGTTRLSSAQTLEDSRALAWDAATIFQLMMHHPSVSLNAVRLIGDRVEQTEDRIQELATSTVEPRLARLLLRLADRVGRKTREGVAIELSLSGRDLAELVITTPYTISRILAGWRRMNVADAQRERILVLDQPRLAAIAGILAREDLPPAG